MADENTITIDVKGLEDDGPLLGPEEAAPPPPGDSKDDRFGKTVDGLFNPSKLDDIDKRIQDTFERLSKNLLTAAEAEERLNRVMGTDKAKDKFRDQHGPEFDSKKYIDGWVDSYVRRGAKDDREGSAANPFELKPDKVKGGPKGKEKDDDGFDFLKLKDTWKDLSSGKMPDVSKMGDISKLFGDPGKLAANAMKLFGGGGGGGAAAGKAAGAAGGEAAGVAGGEAAAAAGGELAAGAAGGPVGLAVAAGVAAADYVSGKMVERMKAVEEGIHAAADVAKSLAGNDGMGALQSGAEAAAKGLEQIPIAGKLWAEEIRLMTTVAGEYAAVIEAFVQRGRELSKYDGGLARANAEADVRKLQADIRESHRMSEELSKLTEAQSRAEVAFQDAITPIKVILVKNLVPLLEKVAALVEMSARSVEILDNASTSSEKIIAAMFEAIPTELTEMMKIAYKKIVDAEVLQGVMDKKKEDANDVFKTLMALPDRLDVGSGHNAQNASREADARMLAEPLFR